MATQIKSREERKGVLEQQLAKLGQQVQLDPQQIDQQMENIRATLESLEAVLDQGGDQSRKVLQNFLGDIPIRCEPFIDGKQKGYRLSVPFSLKN